jgi:hypothetical protein
VTAGVSAGHVEAQHVSGGHVGMPGGGGTLAYEYAKVHNASNNKLTQVHGAEIYIII